MELIEVLVLASLTINFILFITVTYLVAKVSILSKMKSPQQIAEEILKTKVPVLMGPDGVPIMPSSMMPPPPPDGINPIVG